MLMHFAEEFLDDFLGGDWDGTEAFDFEAAGHIGEGDGFGPIGAAAPRDGQHCQDHIASAGDIVDVTLARAEPAALAIARGEVSAAFVESNYGGFEVELFEEDFAG